MNSIAEVVAQGWMFFFDFEDNYSYLEGARSLFPDRTFSNYKTGEGSNCSSLMDPHLHPPAILEDVGKPFIEEENNI